MAAAAGVNESALRGDGAASSRAVPGVIAVAPAKAATEVAPRGAAAVVRGAAASARGSSAIRRPCWRLMGVAADPGPNAAPVLDEATATVCRGRCPAAAACTASRSSRYNVATSVRDSPVPARRRWNSFHGAECAARSSGGGGVGASPRRRGGWSACSVT